MLTRAEDILLTALAPLTAQAQLASGPGVAERLPELRVEARGWRLDGGVAATRAAARRCALVRPTPTDTTGRLWAVTAAEETRLVSVEAPAGQPLTAGDGFTADRTLEGWALTLRSPAAEVLVTLSGEPSPGFTERAPAVLALALRARAPTAADADALLGAALALALPALAAPLSLEAPWTTFPTGGAPGPGVRLRLQRGEVTLHRVRRDALPGGGVEAVADLRLRGEIELSVAAGATMATGIREDLSSRTAAHAAADAAERAAAEAAERVATERSAAEAAERAAAERAAAEAAERVATERAAAERAAAERAAAERAAAEAEAGAAAERAAAERAAAEEEASVAAERAAAEAAAKAALEAEAHAAAERAAAERAAAERAAAEAEARAAAERAAAEAAARAALEAEARAAAERAAAEAAARAAREAEARAAAERAAAEAEARAAAERAAAEAAARAAAEAAARAATPALRPWPCLVFRGGSAVGFGVPAALTALTGPMTVELWARMDALPTGTSRGTLFSRGLLSSASSPGLICVESTGKVLFQGGFKSSTSSSYLARKLVSNAALSTGTWTHLALVRDTASLALRWYVDGVLDNAAPLTGVTGLAGAGAATLTWLGQASGGGDPFQGALAEVRVWSAARTAEEIAASRKVRVPGSTPNLVAAWSLHEGAGATVGDRGPSGITGAITGATWADVGELAGLLEPVP